MLTEENINILKEIREYIIKEDKESSIASNNYCEETLLDDLYTYYTYEVIGCCGCGDTDSTTKAIMNYLNSVFIRHSVFLSSSFRQSKEWAETIKIADDILEENFGFRDVTDNPLLQYLAYSLDDKGLTEHGTSIRGCWLTKSGKHCLYVYQLYFAQQTIDICENINKEDKNGGE